MSIRKRNLFMKMILYKNCQSLKTYKLLQQYIITGKLAFKLSNVGLCYLIKNSSNHIYIYIYINFIFIDYIKNSENKVSDFNKK